MRQPTDPARCAKCAPGALCHDHAGPGDPSAQQILGAVLASEHTTPADVAATIRQSTSGREYDPDDPIGLRRAAAAMRRRRRGGRGPTV